MGRRLYKHGAINGRWNYKHGAINEEVGAISNETTWRRTSGAGTRGHASSPPSRFAPGTAASARVVERGGRPYLSSSSNRELGLCVLMAIGVGEAHTIRYVGSQRGVVHGEERKPYDVHPFGLLLRCPNLLSPALAEGRVEPAIRQERVHLERRAVLHLRRALCRIATTVALVPPATEQGGWHG